MCVLTHQTLSISGRFPGSGPRHGLLSSHSGVVSLLSEPLKIRQSGSEGTLPDFVEDAARIHTPVTHHK